MLYFKQPSIDKVHYAQSLHNIGEIFSRRTAQNASEEPIQSLINLMQEMIAMHAQTHGIAQLTQDLRLLGNAIRIASQSNEDIFIAMQQITWGINAGALHFRSSGEACCLVEALEYIKRTNPTPTIFDIGANIGEWASFAISQLDASSLHIFEPNTSLREELAKKVRDSLDEANSKTKAHINMLGIGDEGKASLYVNDISNEQASTVLRSGKSIYDDYEKIEIDLINGSDYCKSKNIDTIDFLKVDTEGSELAAVKTFDNYIKEGKVKFIQFEYGIASLYGNSTLIRFFETLGKDYTIHRILPEGITNSLKYSEEIETFHWSNYLAIHKDSLDFLDNFRHKSPWTR